MIRVGLIFTLFLTVTAPGHLSAQDWTAFGGSPGGGQYSPLADITPENVTQLEPAWTYRTGELPRGVKSLQINLFEVSPVHANETLYICTRHGRIVALDPATGTERWKFDPQAAGLNADEPRASLCRGVAYWQSATPASNAACEKRVFRVSTTESGARLYAVDADTGKACADFAGDTPHPGFVAFGDYDWGGSTKNLWMSSAPMVIGDLVVIANSGLDNIAADSHDGFVRAFDVRTGTLRWSFSSIPREVSDKTGSSDVWAPFSVDVARGLVIVPTSSPSTDHYGGQRGVDIPLANSVVALKAETGEVAWHFQTIHHDVFDYDLPAQPMLVQLMVDGAMRDVVIQNTKMGLVWVLDRDTGQPIKPFEEKPVPASDIPGEVTSPTQPVPSWPAPISRQTISDDDIYGLTPIDEAWCRRRFEAARYDGMFTPPSLKGSIVFPGYVGGGNWGGAAFDPTRQLLIARAMNVATVMTLVPRDQDDGESESSVRTGARLPMDGTPYKMRMGPFESPLKVPCTRPPWSTLTAIDMTTGEAAWQIPFGQTRKNGITVPKFFGWGSPSAGGPIVTQSGLIFVGSSTDAKIRAFDVRTGDELWSHDLPHPAMTVPASYRAGGRQFVAISAGSYGFSPTEGDDAIVAFALPNTK